jgi:CubicO group peptidase (beta-lactamase class C family)
MHATISLCGVLAVGLTACLAAQTVTTSEPRVGAALQPFVDRGQLAGAVVLVATRDRILAHEAVGYADVKARVPLKPDALFWVASMSKPITASALMILVDQGAVRLDDPVEKYLPEFKGQLVVEKKSADRIVLKKPAHPITVREILSHTSGLVGRSPLEHELDTLSLREAVITYALTPLQFEPGTKYEYCNPGINTAGRLIEVTSHMPYEEFMRTRLFEPLGMKDTTFWPTDEQVNRLAKSYKPGAKNTGLEEITITQLSYPLSDRKRHPYPAGGLFSTAADMARFCQMILAGGVYEGKRYLSESAVRQMTSTQTGKLIDGRKGEAGYGLGWSTSRKAQSGNSAVILGPCGHGGAYATHMGIDPERGLITVYLVQHAGFPGIDGGKIEDAFNKAAIAVR